MSFMSTFKLFAFFFGNFFKFNPENIPLLKRGAVNDGISDLTVYY